MINGKAKLRYWIVAGLLLLAGVVAMSILSGRLSPLKPGSERPLHLFVTCYAVSWAGYVVAYRLVLRNPGQLPVWLMVCVALIARLTFLPSELIQSDDCYRYILDGQSLLAGINPYAYTPEQIQASLPAELIGDHMPEARVVIEHVNNAHVPTIYPPLSLAVFAAGASLTPWHIDGQRWMFLLCDLATMALLAGLLRRFNKPPAWLVVYAWNPLVIKEISNSAHLDSLVALWLIVLIAVLAGSKTSPDSQSVSSIGRAALAGLAVGGAILSKLYPMLLLPCCAAYIARGRRAIVKLAVMAVTAGGLVYVCYWPFMDVGMERVTAGLRTYAEHWVNNPGAFAVMEMLFNRPRPVSETIVVIVALLAAWRLWRSRRGPDDLVLCMQTSLLCWFLLSPACFPWYVVGLVALCVLRPRGWCVVLTGALGLFYLLRHIDYRGWPENWQLAVQLFEHGVIWTTLAAAVLRRVPAIKEAPR